MKAFFRAATFVFLATLPMKSFAGWDINFSPLSGLIGLIDLSVNVQVSSNWTAGVILDSWNTSLLGTKVGLSGYGVRGNYYFSGAYQDSWYVSPVYKSFSINMTDETTTLSASATSTSIGAMVGYWWNWSTFQLNLGYGLMSSSATELQYSDGSKEKLPAITGSGLEFQIGWHF